MIYSVLFISVYNHPGSELSANLGLVIFQITNYDLHMMRPSIFLQPTRPHSISGTREEYLNKFLQ